MKNPQRRGGRGWYITTYRVADSTYGGFIHARSWAEARRIAEARNSGESISSPFPWRQAPYFTPSQLLSKRVPEPLEIIHGTIFLAWLAARAGVASSTEMLADTGIVHEVTHHFTSEEDPPSPPRRVLIDRLRTLERAVPGYTDGN